MFSFQSPSFEHYYLAFEFSIYYKVEIKNAPFVVQPYVTIKEHL